MEKVKHPPTEEQQQIIDATAQGDDSLMIEAYAGCSKSTSLEMAAPGVRVPALALAFNKKIAQELSPRMPGNFSVKTLNALGHGAWARANPHVLRMELDDRKLGKVINEATKDRDLKLTSEQWDDLRRLVSAAMRYGITPGDQGEPLMLDTRENWQTIAEEDLMLLPESFSFLTELAHETLERSVALARGGKISFDDQVYCSVCLGGRFTKYPAVFVDESQDLSPLNHAMLEKSLREDGRLTAVGDPRQAIYGFRGADAKSMETMRALRPTWKDLALTMTFRCPKAIVARQQEHAPGFRAWHTNAEGVVDTLFRRSFDSEQETLEGWSWKTVMDRLPAPSVQPVILCRNNGPLLGMAFKLLRQQIGVTMLGRDIGKSLIALARKITKGNDSMTADLVAGAINEWLEHEVSLAKANDQPHKVDSLTDRAECLQAVLESTECKTAGDLVSLLQKLFARESGQVMLSTIHRFKGLESDLVLHLDPWRIPSRWAREAAKEGDFRQLEQEKNLRYVAETRAKHTLLLADLEGFR